MLYTEAVVGSDIILPCEAKGNPKPDIFWLKGNLDVSVFGQRFQVLPNGYLKIIAVQEVDEDVYTCVANNVISRRSQPAYLLVTSKSQVFRCFPQAPLAYLPSTVPPCAWVWQPHVLYRGKRQTSLILKLINLN